MNAGRTNKVSSTEQDHDKGPRPIGLPHTSAGGPFRSHLQPQFADGPPHLPQTSVDHRSCLVQTACMFVRAAPYYVDPGRTPGESTDPCRTPPASTPPPSPVLHLVVGSWRTSRWWYYNKMTRQGKARGQRHRVRHRLADRGLSSCLTRGPAAQYPKHF